MEYPLRQIAQNAGGELAVVVDKVRAIEGNHGFDGASVTGLMITTEAMLSETPEDNPPAPPGSGGMPDMGVMN